MPKTTITIDDVRRKIEAGEYYSKLLFKTREGRVAYYEDQGRLNLVFKTDLMAALGLTNHPKADLFYRKVWDLGHSSGFHEVTIHAEDLAELMKG